MKQVFLNQINCVNTTTYYYHPQTGFGVGGTYNYTAPTTTEGLATLFAGDTGTIWDFNVNLDSAPGAGKSWTFTVNVNGVGSALTATVSDTDTSARSSASPVSVSAGDAISIEVVPSGSPTNSVANISLEATTNTAGYSVISGGFRDQTSTIYGPFGNFLDRNNTLVDTAYDRITAPFDFTIRAIYTGVGTAPGAGADRGFQLLLNGGDQGSYYVEDTNTTGSYTGLSIAVSQGDTLGCVYKEVSGPDDSDFIYSAVIEADTDGLSWVNTTYIYGATADTKGCWWGGSHIDNTARLFYCGTTGFSLKNLFQVSDVLGATADRVVTLYKNGSPTALTCQIAGLGSSANDTSNEVAFADGDNGDLIMDTTNDTEEGAVAIAMYIAPSTPKGLPLLYAG